MRELKPVPEEALSLLERMEALEEEVRLLKQELSSTQDKIASDIASDRRRIAALEEPDWVPGKTEIARAQIVIRYINARPDHKATYETLKGHLRVNDAQLSCVVKTLGKLFPGRYKVQRAKGDKRKRELLEVPHWK